MDDRKRVLVKAQKKQGYGTENIDTKGASKKRKPSDKLGSQQKKAASVRHCCCVIEG